MAVLESQHMISYRIAIHFESLCVKVNTLHGHNLFIHIKPLFWWKWQYWSEINSDNSIGITACDFLYAPNTFCQLICEYKVTPYGPVVVYYRRGHLPTPLHFSILKTALKLLFKCGTSLKIALINSLHCSEASVPISQRFGYPVFPLRPCHCDRKKYSCWFKNYPSIGRKVNFKNSP